MFGYIIFFNLNEHEWWKNILRAIGSESIFNLKQTLLHVTWVDDTFKNNNYLVLDYINHLVQIFTIIVL